MRMSMMNMISTAEKRLEIQLESTLFEFIFMKI